MLQLVTQMPQISSREKSVTLPCPVVSPGLYIKSFLLSSYGISLETSLSRLFMAPPGSILCEVRLSQCALSSSAWLA